MDKEALQKIQETHKEVGEAIEQCSFKKGLRAVNEPCTIWECVL